MECEIQRGSGDIGRVVLEQDIVVPSGHEMIIPGRSQFDSASELLCMLEPGHQATKYRSHRGTCVGVCARLQEHTS